MDRRSLIDAMHDTNNRTAKISLLFLSFLAVFNHQAEFFQKKLCRIFFLQTINWFWFAEFPRATWNPGLNVHLTSDIWDRCSKSMSWLLLYGRGAGSRNFKLEKKFNQTGSGSEPGRLAVSTARVAGTVYRVTCIVLCIVLRELLRTAQRSNHVLSALTHQLGGARTLCWLLAWKHKLISLVPVDRSLAKALLYMYENRQSYFPKFYIGAFRRLGGLKISTAVNRSNKKNPFYRDFYGSCCLLNGSHSLIWE